MLIATATILGFGAGFLADVAIAHPFSGFLPLHVCTAVSLAYLAGLVTRRG